MRSTPPDLAPVGVASGHGPDNTWAATEECARAEAQRLWAALAQARAVGAPGATAAAEDNLFRFYLPVARALGDAAAGAAVQSEAARHAAEVGLAQAVLGWPASDNGFLEFASRSITTVLRHLPVGVPGRRHPLLPLDFSPLPGGGSQPAPGSHTSVGRAGPYY